MNTVNLLGRIVADTEVKATSAGMHFCAFTVACDNGKDKPADFIECVAFDKTAEIIAQYFGKGKPIAIEGKLNVRSFTDKEGKNRKTTSVVVNRFEFVPQSAKEEKPRLDVLPKNADNPNDDGFQDVSDLPF